MAQAHGDLEVTAKGSAIHCRAADERGVSLIIVLVIMLLSGLTVAAMMTYASVSLRSSRDYTERAERTQVASDAIDAAIAFARVDREQGLDGESYTVTMPNADAACTGLTGSGEGIPLGYADRKIRCEAKVEGQVAGVKDRLVMTVEFRVVDQRGDSPGAAVEVTARSVSG